MSYTVLRLTHRGVVLRDGHLERLGKAARADWDRFEATAAPGIYAVSVVEGALVAVPREGSRLETATQVRRAVTPVVGQQGAMAKPQPPCVYDAVRSPTTVTLLTSVNGAEVYEACVAAVIAWDGRTLVLPPEDAPLVDSVAARHLAAHFPHRRAPILTANGWPLLLLNAVSQRVVDEGSRWPFPVEVARAVADSIAATAT